MWDRRRYESTYSTTSVNAMMYHDPYVGFLTKLVIFFNLMFAILGAMVFGMGFYICLENDFRGWIGDLGMQHYYTGVYILMGAGILVIVQSFFGICGAYQRKGRFLQVFFVCLVVCFLLEVAGAAYMLNNGIRYSKIEDWLHWKFLELIAAYNTDEASARIMNIIQEYVGCCGADGIQDYVRWNKVIPNTCYNQITGNAWYFHGYGYVGCVRGFTNWLEPLSGWISGLALSLAFFQIFCMIAACCLINIKRDYTKSTHDLSGSKAKI